MSSDLSASWAGPGPRGAPLPICTFSFVSSTYASEARSPTTLPHKGASRWGNPANNKSPPRQVAYRSNEVGREGSCQRAFPRVVLRPWSARGGSSHMYLFLLVPMLRRRARRPPCHTRGLYGGVDKCCTSPTQSESSRSGTAPCFTLGLQRWRRQWQAAGRSNGER